MVCTISPFVTKYLTSNIYIELSDIKNLLEKINTMDFKIMCIITKYIYNNSNKKLLAKKKIYIITLTLL